MARTACLVCLVTTVSGCCKNTLGRASARRGHVTKLSNLLFLVIYVLICLRRWVMKIENIFFKSLNCLLFQIFELKLMFAVLHSYINC
jgi:hypothetical protein